MTTDLQPAGGPTNPLALLQTAIEKGMDPDKLGRLMDLADRWKADRAAELFAQAMNAAQQQMPVVVRDAENTHTRSKYARLETVNAAVKPVYAANGFSLSYGTEECKLPDHIRVVCDVTHTGGCTKRYAGDFPLDGAGAKGAANKAAIQASGSTISYARRYLALMIFNVTVANEDTDGNAADFISPDQIGQINDLALQCEKAGDPVRWPNFLRWLDVDSLANLPREKVELAKHELNRKLKAAAK